MSSDGGGRGGKPQQNIQSPDRLNKAPTDYSKPQQTIRSPDRLHKDITYSTKRRIVNKPINISQE